MYMKHVCRSVVKAHIAQTGRAVLLLAMEFGNYSFCFHLVHPGMALFFGCCDIAVRW